MALPGAAQVLRHGPEIRLVAHRDRQVEARVAQQAVERHV